MKKNILFLNILLLSNLQSSNYLININDNLYKNSIVIERTDSNVDTKIRKLCYDILIENPSSSNGVYLVDIDGDNNFHSAKSAYCDMTNGGWTLYDDFGKIENSKEALNATGINSFSTLEAAGYSHFASYINHPSYPINNEYISFIVGGNYNDPASMGKIYKTLPDYITKIKADVAVLRAGDDIITINFGNSEKTTKSKTKTGIEITDSGEFTVTENNFAWIDSLWIK